MKQGIRDQSSFHDGHQDGLEPVKPVDLNEIDSFDAMLRAFADASFGAAAATRSEHRRHVCRRHIGSVKTTPSTRPQSDSCVAPDSKHREA